MEFPFRAVEFIDLSAFICVNLRLALGF